MLQCDEFFLCPAALLLSLLDGGDDGRQRAGPHEGLGEPAEFRAEPRDRRLQPLALCRSLAARQIEP
ncbi:MAG: hypothetical protein Q8S13_01535, partial [Dehalococcoidia bacterium]|nr:hypothetical protein [Dehalococcoidia bacterium]